MLNNWLIIVASLAYIGVLFAIATYSSSIIQLCRFQALLNQS